MKIVIPIHSFVDVITNSSTTIYTYQDGSIEAVKDVINEVLELTKEGKKTDDLFWFGVFCDNNTYGEYLDELEDEDIDIIEIPTIDYSDDKYEASQKIQDKWFNDLKLSVMSGIIKTPEWMIDAEEGREDWFSPSSYLNIVTKDDKYKPLAEKLVEFINTVSADGGRDG